jgi:hypothetical protein
MKNKKTVTNKINPPLLNKKFFLVGQKINKNFLRAG